MPESLLRKVACLLIVAPSVGLAQGCGPDRVELTEAPPVTIPPAQKPEELPKSQRPAKGASSGMNYNPLTGQPE